MYGTPRYDKEEIVELLKQGVSQKEITQQYNIPQSTVSLWSRQLRADKVRTPEEEKARFRAVAKIVNDSEAKIENYVSRIVADDISDKDWFEFTKALTIELQKLAIKALD